MSGCSVYGRRKAEAIAASSASIPSTIRCWRNIRVGLQRLYRLSGSTAQREYRPGEIAIFARTHL